MLQRNYIFTTFLVFLSLSATKSPLAFYYTHELSTIPSKLLEPYKQKHHLSDSFQKIFDRGLKAYSEMDYLRAEQAYNTLILINTRDIIALERLAQVYLKQGKINLAINTLLKILRIEPEYHPAHNHLAQIYLYKKDFRQSILHAKYLVENGLAYLETYLYLINALFFMKQYDNMISICRVARDAGAEHPQFFFFPLLADLILNNTESSKIVSKLENSSKESTPSLSNPFSLNQFQDHPDILLYKYLIELQKAGDPSDPKVRKVFGEIEKNHSNLVYTFMFLSLGVEAIAYNENKDYLWKHAIKMSNRVIQNSTSFLLPYRTSLNILRKRRSFEQILTLATSAHEKFPEYTTFLEYLGEAAFFLNKSELALDSLQKALQIRNSNPDYLAYTAILMLQKKNIDPQEALGLIDLALNQDPVNPFAQTALGLFYYNAGEPQRASISFKQAIAKKVQHPLAWNLMIKMLRKDRSYNSAYNIAKQARLIFKDVQIYRHAIELAFQRNEYRDCIAFGEEGIEKTGDNRYFSYLVAQSYMKLNDYENALASFSHIGAKPDNREEHNLLYLDILISIVDQKKKKLDELKNKEQDVPELAEAHDIALNDLEKDLNERAVLYDKKLTALLKIHRRNPRYLTLKANFYYRKEKFKQALKTFRGITKSKEFLVHTAWLEFLNKIEPIRILSDPKALEAISDLTGKLTIASKIGNNELRALANYRLGLIYSITPERSSYLEYYKKAKELAPKLKLASQDHYILNKITNKNYDGKIEKNRQRYTQ